MRIPWEFVVDAGWGYHGALVKDAAEKIWLALMARGRLLPATVMDWLVDEVPGDFLSGRVFVVPAEAVGINPNDLAPTLTMWAEINGGTAVVPDDLTAATELMALEIPFLDSMSSAQFQTFLKDHEGELTAFRRAFQKLVAVRDKSEIQAHDVVKELQFQIAELTRADKFAKIRNRITTLGGTIGSVSAAVAIATKPENSLWWAGIAGAGAASVSLLNMWKQTVDAEERMAQNPYFILWKLGIAKPRKVRKTVSPKTVKAPPMPPLQEFAERLGVDHWLCPPTPGFRVVVPKQSGLQEAPGGILRRVD